MNLHFDPHCCDASYYLTLGERCARAGECWDMERPVGAVVFASLPFRLGLSPEFLIIVNFLLIAASVFLAGLAVQALYPKSRQGPGRAWTWLAAAVGHLVFMYGDAWVTLMDLPAATIALIGLWLLVLGGCGRRAGLTALSGLALGAAVILRPFYLYPAILAGIGMLAAWLLRRRCSPAALAGFALCLCPPILLQCASTYRHLGQWAIADAATKERSLKYHATAPWMGFDSLMPGSPIFYPAGDCFRERIEGGPLMNGAQTTGQQPYQPKYPLYEAYQAGDYAGIACVYMKKQWFYFGSYAWHTYLSEPGERVFSRIILLLNLAMMAGFGYFMLGLAQEAAPAAIISLFAAATWAGATLLQPESRYMMACDAALWTFGLAGVGAFWARLGPAKRDADVVAAARLPWPALLFAAIVIALFHPFLLQGRAYLGGSDRLFSAVPFLTLAARSLAHNHLPLWNPFNLAGCRGIGEAVNRSLYPPTLLLLKLFPAHVVLADTARLVAEFAFMLWIGYKLFLKVWDDELLALFSTLTYSLSVSTFMILNFPFAVPYAPLLMLYLLWDWSARPMARNVAGLSAALILQVLGSSAQISAYFILFVFGVCAARALSQRRAARFLGMWAAAGALALLFCSPDLLPFLQAFGSSNRAPLPYPEIVARFQQPWYSPFRLVLPFFMGDYWRFPGLAGYPNANDSEFFPTYAGVAAFFFCALALTRPRRREVWPWAAAIGLLVLMAVRSPFAVIPYTLFLRSPLLHGRLAYLVPLCMAFLAPAGIRVFLDATRREQGRMVAFVALATLVVFAFASGLFGTRWSLLGAAGLMSDELLASARAAADIFGFLGLALAGILLAHREGALSARGFKVACLALLAADLLYFASRHSMAASFAPESAWHPDNAIASYLQALPDREDYRVNVAMGTPWPGLAPFAPGRANPYQPSLNVTYGLRDVNGYASFIDKRYAELAMQGRPHENPLRIPLGWSELLAPKLAGLMAVKYFVVSDGDARLSAALAQDADKVFAAEGAAVYRRRRPVPRFHLACRTHPLDQLSEVLALARAPSFDAATDAVVEPGSGLDYDGSACAGHEELTMRGEEPELLSGQARLDKPALLVISETYDPGWRAFVNGEPAPVRRADYAFMGVPLPAGDSRVELRFSPPHYGAALTCCGLALALLLLLAVCPADVDFVTILSRFW